MRSGSTCSVAGCYNNSRKIKILSETVCTHHQKLRKVCPCPVPYSLHSMPTKEERRQAWLAALRLKKLPKRVYVCSFHFVEKGPTEMHPDPELFLGYDQFRKQQSRQMIVLTETTDSCSNANRDAEAGPRKLKSNIDTPLFF